MHAKQTACRVRAGRTVRRPHIKCRPTQRRCRATATSPTHAYTHTRAHTNHTMASFAFAFGLRVSDDVQDKGRGDARGAVDAAASSGGDGAAFLQRRAPSSTRDVPGDLARHPAHTAVAWDDVHNRSRKHPGKALRRGTFTACKFFPPLPTALTRVATLPQPRKPLLARGWVWVPPAHLRDDQALRDAVYTPKRVFNTARPGAAPWQRAAFAKRMRAEALDALRDAGHGQGRMPREPRDAWPPGALCMYRNMKQRDDGGVWLPRGLAAQLFSGAPAMDDTSLGEPLRDGGAPRATLLERLHQPQAVRAVTAHWDAARPGAASGVLLMPCGYGKSITAMHIARAAGRRTVWIVPRRVLGGDAIRAVQAVFPNAQRVKHGAHAAASDGDSGQPPFTVAFLDGNSSDKLHPATCGVDVLVLSVHTLLSRCDTFTRKDWTAFGTLIVDEAHMMSHRALHALAVIPARRVLALSATPYRSDGTTPSLYWAFGPLLFACRRPSMALNGEVWRWSAGQPATRYKPDGAVDNTESINALCGKDPLRKASIVNTVHAVIDAGRRVLLMAGRVAYMQSIAAQVTTERSQDAWTAVPCPPRFAPSADAVQALLGDGVAVDAAAKEIRVAPAVCMHSGTPVVLRNVLLHAAPCVCAHPSLAKVGLSCPTLDTLIMATPMTDPEQIVGRITRADSTGRPPLVIDFLDPHEPFLNMWKSRAEAYDFLDMDTTYRNMTRGITRKVAADILGRYNGTPA